MLLRKGTSAIGPLVTLLEIQIPGRKYLLHLPWLQLAGRPEYIPKDPLPTYTVISSTAQGKGNHYQAALHTHLPTNVSHPCLTLSNSAHITNSKALSVIGSSSKTKVLERILVFLQNCHSLFFCTAQVKWKCDHPLSY